MLSGMLQLLMTPLMRMRFRPVLTVLQPSYPPVRMRPELFWKLAVLNLRKRILKQITIPNSDGIQALIATRQAGIGDMIKHNR